MKFEEKNFNYYGEDNQLNKMIEELLELVEAIDFYKTMSMEGNGPLCFNHMCEEMADVQFMLNQFKTQKSYNERIKWWYKFKINRQKERLNAAD